MAFDRAGAKAAGYTDAEIDEYLSSGAEPDSTVQQENVAGSNDLLRSLVPPLALSGLAIAGKKGVSALVKSKAAGNLAESLPIILKRALSRRTPAEVKDIIKASKGELRGGSKGKGNVPSRPISVQGKPAARAPAQTAEPPYTGGRGASGPELARRAEAMAQATGGRPPLSLVPQEMPQLPPARTLEEQLQRALAAEQAMGAKGLTGASRIPMLKALRSVLGEVPSISPMVMPGNAATPEQELQNALEQFLMIQRLNPAAIGERYRRQ